MGKLGSFLIGGAVGAGLALLFAPRSGEETRALVAEKADEYWGKGQVWVEQGKDRVQDTYSRVQPKIAAKGDELRDKIDNARTLIAEQVAKNATAARDAINERIPVATEKLSQAADVVRGHIDNAASKIKERAAAKDADGESTTADDSVQMTASFEDAAKAANDNAAVPANAAPMATAPAVVVKTAENPQ